MDIVGVSKNHPHYAIIKCSQCDYTYVESNTTAESQGVCKMESITSEAEHPHRLIFKCTFEGCGHTLIIDDKTAEFELVTSPDNYGVAHPHYLYGECDYDGCDHQEATSTTADWSWDDGVCSICGITRDVTHKISGTTAEITGLINDNFSGVLSIPSTLDGHPVEVISFSAFSGNANITYVSIPETVTIIEDMAFENCTNLQLRAKAVCPVCGISPSIRIEPSCLFCRQNDASGNPVGDIGRHVSIIGEGAFRNCSQLQIVALGPHIQEIRSFAFEGCDNLIHISVASPVAPLIGIDVFGNGTTIFVPFGALGYDSPEWGQYTIKYVDFLIGE